jgi:hypothetical protein
MHRAASSWLSTLTKFGFEKLRRGRPRRCNYSRRLRAEALEERRMLAALNLTESDVFAYANPGAGELGNDDQDDSLPTAVASAAGSFSNGVVDYSSFVSSTASVISPGGILPDDPSFPLSDWWRDANGTFVYAQGMEQASWEDGATSAGLDAATASEAHSTYEFDGITSDTLFVRLQFSGLIFSLLGDDVPTEFFHSGLGFSATLKFELFRDDDVDPLRTAQVSVDDANPPFGPQKLLIWEDLDGDGTDEFTENDYSPAFNIQYAFTVEVQDGDVLKFHSEGGSGPFPEFMRDDLATITGGAGVFRAGGLDSGGFFNFWSGFAGIAGRVNPFGSEMPAPDPNDTTPPQVTNVTISGTNSIDDPYVFSDHDGSGEQLVPIAVNGADTIEIEFSEDVYVFREDLTLIGLHPGNEPSVEDFTLNGNVATWVFSEPFAPDQYRITLDDFVTDTSFNFLDGEWDNPTAINDPASSEFGSGDSTAGGDFEFDFTTALVVSTEIDDGDDDDYSVGNLSIREAVNVAASLTGPQTIVFAQNVVDVGEIQLNSPIVIGTISEPLSSDLVIQGPGFTKLTIDLNGNPGSVFSVERGTGDVTISGLTITGATYGMAKGVSKTSTYSSQNLTLEGVRVTGNSFGVQYAYNGSLTVRDSEIVDNLGYADFGFGVSISYASSHIERSTIAKNEGSGVSVGHGSATIVNTTVSDNKSPFGALTIAWGSALLVNTTIVKNHAVLGSGGVYLYTHGSAEIHNSIVSLNTLGASNVPSDLASGGGTFDSSSSYNLVGENDSTSFPSGNGNTFGVTAGDLNLTPDLANYGGITRTYGLMDNSWAINAGDNQYVNGQIGDEILYDQRGEGFARIFDDDDDIVDIGAFESGNMSYLGAAALAGDEMDGIYVDGELSLREALAMAAEMPGPETIYIDASAGTITLNDEYGELLIDSDVTIIGPGADLLTIDADGEGRVFRVASGNTVEISGLTIKGGATTGGNDGAGIHNYDSDLTLRSVVVTENHSADHGGGVYNHEGTVHIIASTISANTATTGGGISSRSNEVDSLVIEGSAIINNEATHAGGIRVDDISNISGPSATIINTTISGNDSDNDAGGIQTTPFFLLTIVNSTITNNSAGGIGGGIRNSGGSVKLYNSIIAGNTAGGSTWRVDWADNGAHSSSANNLIGVNGTSGLTHGVAGNQVGSTTTPLDPLLTALGDYGGPTLTHALLEDSPAIDAGDNDVALTYGALDENSKDQRGLLRISDWEEDDDDDLIDIGAVELAVEEVYS